MTDLEAFSVNLRRHRRSQDITQDALASKLGMRRENIVYYEKGTQVPRLDVVIRLAKILKIDLIDFFDKETK